MSDSFATPWTAAQQVSLSITNSRVYSNSCPLSHWCHPTISSFVAHFSSCCQSFPAWGSFPMSRLFTSGSQSTGDLASVQFSSVQLLSRVRLFVTPWTAILQASLSITNSRAYSNSCPLHQGCHPAISSSVIPFSSCLQSFPASGSFPIGQWPIRWPKYWSFSFSISPSNEYSGMISFRMDWLDVLEVQGIADGQ